MENIKRKYPLVAVFRNNKDTTPSELKPLNEVLVQINNCTNYHIIDPCRKFIAEGKKDEYDKLKDTLPGFTVCGTFEPSRAIKFLKTYSGFLILDIDKLELAQVQEMKQKLCAMALTFCCFISPSGLGLKVIVRVSSSAEQHKTAYRQVKEIYEKELGIEIDKSGSDVSRLCYYSSDSKIYINEDASIFTPHHEQKIERPAPQHNTLNTGTFSADVFEKCVQLTENIYKYVEGERNNFVHLLANNCNRNGIAEAEATYKIKANYNYDDVEVSSTIKSAFGNAQNEFGKYAPKEKITSPLKINTLIKSVPLKELIRRAKLEPPIPFIWNGIKQGAFGFIFGPSKSGKTTFCENLAMSIAACLVDFFGQPITSGTYKVCFISLEEFWTQRTERNTRQADHLSEILGSDDWQDNFEAIDEKVPRLINSEDEWQIIENIIVNCKANVVFVDSMSRLYEGSLEESGLAKKICMRLRELSNKLKITLIVIHHTPKQSGKPLSIDSLAGSRILAQESDFMIGIGRTPEGKRYMKEVAYRYRPENDEFVTVFEMDTDQWITPTVEMPEAALLKESDGRTDDTNPEQIFDFIYDKTHSEQGETYAKELMKEFVETEEVSKQTLYTCLKKLEKAKRITKQGRGVYKSITEKQSA
jgi:KaiC/GvpD/RAD55 family RecA-like ATPase